MENLGKLGNVIPNAVSSQPENEDCLFLDVMSPVQVFDGARSDAPNPVPVLVNIHGGGFFSGDKTAIYNPQGLLHQSQNRLVYVSMNYRVRLNFESRYMFHV